MPIHFSYFSLEMNCPWNDIHGAMELNFNPAIETKEKRLIPRWLAISAVVLSTISLLISALALVSIADSEEEEVNQLGCSTLYEVLAASLASPVEDGDIWKIMRDSLYPYCYLDWDLPDD